LSFYNGTKKQSNGLLFFRVHLEAAMGYLFVALSILSGGIKAFAERKSAENTVV